VIYRADVDFSFILGWFWLSLGVFKGKDWQEVESSITGK